MFFGLLVLLLAAMLLMKYLMMALQVGIHPSSAEEFVTMRSVTRRVAAAGSKSKTNL